MNRTWIILLAPILLLSACARFGGGKEEGEIGLAPKIRDRVWTLEQPPAPGESATVSYWRQRYNAWRSGSLSDYPFEAPGATVVTKGDGITESVITFPARSVHETEPWGDEGCLWPILNRWSPEWERRYSEWIKTVSAPDFLAQNNIPVDCSDAPYVYRIIFARINYLPQGVHDITGSTSFGNWSTRFAHLPTAEDWRVDQRFREGLKYAVEAYIRGRSVPFDTYPIDCRPQTGVFRPGSIGADSHHVRLISSINSYDVDPIRQLSATRPRKIRILSDETLSNVIENDGPGWGMLNFSWWDYDFNLHRYRTVPDRKMPGYSLMQYQVSDASYINTDIIQSWYRQEENIDPEKALANQIADLREALRVRAEVVQEGWAYYQAHPNDRDKTSMVYDDYSSPGRDARMMQKVDSIRQLARRYNYPGDWVDRKLAEIIIPLGNGQTSDMRSIAYRLQHRAMSPEPWDSPERRWGLDLPVPPIEVTGAADFNSFGNTNSNGEWSVPSGLPVVPDQNTQSVWDDFR